MKTAILYGSSTALTPQHKAVNCGAQAYFVRMEICDEEDCLRALNKAEPMEGETVLNSVELPIEETVLEPVEISARQDDGHAGDCTIYAIATMDSAADGICSGICTCGYGLREVRTGDWSKMVSLQRKAL
jgi:hypothetical protein